MKISDNGIRFIQDREGLRLRAYQDSAGVWTIGYGHTHNVKKGDVITQDQATQLLVNDLQTAERQVNDVVNVPLNQNQYDALVSFEFNAGALHKSTLLKFLNTNNYLSAANHFMDWDKARVNGKLTVVEGLRIRRTLEMNLFLS